jgi:hypothetical protein
MKAQMSIEYLFVIALAMGMVLVTAYVYFVQSSEISEQQQITNVEVMAQDILSVAKNVYHAGGISKKTANYKMPPIVNNVYVVENALVFNVTTDGSTYELVYYSDVPIIGDFPETKYYTEQIAHILIINNEDYVLLCTEEFGCD